MTYGQTLQFLYSQLPAFHRVGKAAYKSDLHNTLEFDDYLGHPHKNYSTIHVGGTNGKGSVSHMIASVLMEAGYKTGLYTSPHLKDFRERIKVNGKMIGKSDVTSFIKKHSQFIKSLEPSFFEMTVALAFDYFAECKVDVAVIEVGLGGRLDSTNIITPLLSLITNIGHDHMDLLGNTLGEIAKEKAGIIKENVPVVISETHPETKDLFISKAGELHSPIYFADQNFFCELSDGDVPWRWRKYSLSETATDILFKGRAGLGGDYQSKNIQAVFQVFKVLNGVFAVGTGNIIDGIRKVITNTHLTGRWQIIGRNPLTICDTGHNREGLEYVINQINRMPKTALHLVLGFVNDKDLSLVLPLFPADANYYFTKASVPRALDENALMVEASVFGLKGSCYSDVRSALQAARMKAADTDLIFVGGSTFVVADAL